MKAKLIQIDILNCTIRTCVTMFEATGDKKYLGAANLASSKFNKIVNEIKNLKNNTKTVFIKQ